MRTLVVYYSRSGNTRRVAEKMAETAGADLQEIVPLKKDRLFFAAAKAFLCKGTKIEPPVVDFEVYDMVAVGSPVWAGKLSPPVRTFLHEYAALLPKTAAFLTRADKENAYAPVFDEMQRAVGKELALRLSFCAEQVKRAEIDLAPWEKLLKE